MVPSNEILKHAACREAVHVAIVGGGFSAATLIVQLARASTFPIAITVVEPRENLGRGLAYSANDPDHRLNNPLDNHALDPNNRQELHDWCQRSGVLDTDPECRTRSGQIFLRRRDLGAYLTQELARLADGDRPGISLSHVRDTVEAVSAEEDGYVILTKDGRTLFGEMLVVATGNSLPSLRAPFGAELLSHARVIGNPLVANCLEQIPVDASVLVVGGGLTALDVVSTLQRRNHLGKVLVISRRGLRPRGHSPQVTGEVPLVSARAAIVDTASAKIPPFMEDAPRTARGWCTALRKEIRAARAAGLTWHVPFDELRDAVRKLWPELPLKEKHRFLRHLRVFYDVHRFRSPPMNDEVAQRAVHAGRLRFAAASLTAASLLPDESGIGVQMKSREPDLNSRFDFVVNCTGIESTNGWRSNPALLSMVKKGLLSLHGTGIGFDVGPQCEALDHTGEAQALLRVIGPPTAGTFGDPLGAPFISAQVRQILPDLLAALEKCTHARSGS